MTHSLEPAVVFGTPRKLPKARSLDGRVVVLDIAFAADGAGSSFDSVTKTFIDGLGARLAMWVDHHDHEAHARYADDERFLLRKKAQHGACPELVTPELVRSVGPVDTIVCHNDFDGLMAAAKWLRGGEPCYEGADDDARAIDTRQGQASALGVTLDRALRSGGRDETLYRRVVKFLAGGASDGDQRAEFEELAEVFARKEARTRELAQRYRVQGDVAICDVVDVPIGGWDKTTLLLLGQERAKVALVLDDQNATLAAAFDSGIDFLALLGITGGMPTVVSVPRSRLSEVLEKLRAAGFHQ